MKNKLIPALASAAIFLPMIFSHSCANTTQAPSGGKRDTIPPVVLSTIPENGVTQVPLKGFKIVFKFDEYCVVKNQQNIMLSPPQVHPPVAKIKGKSLEVSFEDEFQPNTTYNLSFNNALADNNEGNMLPGFTYVFSTGTTIDSLFITGTVLDSKKMEPLKDITVMLYQDLSDSAVLKDRPFAAVKTDEWGYFSIAFIKDTLYRLYAVKDANNNGFYDPDAEQIAFKAEDIRPVSRVADSLPELIRYEAKDTANCLARKSEYQLVLFREKPTKQFVRNSGRITEKSGFVSFFAPNAWVDSVWIAGYPKNRLITQFNPELDSMLFWVNDRRTAPDTLHMFVSYRKTDENNKLKPDLEHLPLVLLDKDGKPVRRQAHRKLEKTDTTCALTVAAVPEKVEYKGIEFNFEKPIVEQNFKDVKLSYRNVKQKEFDLDFTWERDSLDLLHYVLKPVTPFQQGMDYYLKVPHHAFRDMDGWYTDSTELKFSLPNKDAESCLKMNVSGVDGRYYIEVLNEKMTDVLRDFWIESDGVYEVFYLKEGRYRIRITSDDNRNGRVDTGSLLEKRQPEKVRFVEFDDKKDFAIAPNAEVSQDIDIKTIFAD